MAMSLKNQMFRVAAAAIGVAFLMALSASGLSQDKEDPKAKKDAPMKEAPAIAKDKDKEKDDGEAEPKSRYASLVRAGYTRPGAPEDRVNKKGKIIPAA